MGLEQAIDITATQRKTVLALLQRHLPRTEAWVYGSRAKWTALPQSDLDLVVFATPDQRNRIGALREAFEESDLPFRVDLFVWDEVPEEFREEIESEHIVLVAPPELGRSREKDEWIESTLGDVSDFVSGGTPAKSNAEYWDGLIPWVSAKDMKHSRIYDTEDHVTDSGVDNGTKLVPEGTVLLLVRGMRLVNEVPVCVAQRPMTFNQDVKALRAKSDVTSQYLPYLLLGNKQRLLSLVDLAGHGTGRLNVDELKALDVVFPAPTEQCAIAHVLGTLDDKIDLNRRMNETLDAMARALFKSWFVDFDPVRAKMQRRDSGLPRHIADLFPDRLVDSEMGEIPEGWEVRPLIDLIEVNPSRSLKKGQDAPYLNMANMPTQGHTPAVVITRPFGSGMRFMNGDTLVARITPCLENGKTAYVDFLEDGQIGWGSTEYIVMRPKPPLPNEFAYFLARSHRFREYAIQNMSGTSGRQRVQAKALWLFPTTNPSKKVAEAFGTLIHSFIVRASVTGRESRSLAGLRDSLLPKLISGEIHLRKAENPEGETCTA